MQNITQDQQDMERGMGGSGGMANMDRGMDRGMSGGGMGRDGMGGGMDRSMGGRDMAGQGGPHARSRSASRGFPTRTPAAGPGYHSLDRDRDGYGAADRDFMPIDRPRDRSLDRSQAAAGMGSDPYGPPARDPYGSAGYGRRDRSLDRGRDPMLDPDDGLYTGRDPMAHRNTRLSPNPVGVRDSYMASHGLQELQSTNSDLQRDLANLKKELELTNQKLGSSMHSIKTFWSPELKKERALRKEESAKYALMNDQLKLLNSENQVRRLFTLRCQ